MKTILRTAGVAFSAVMSLSPGLGAPSLHAQTVLQDDQGKTSLLIPATRSIVGLNTGDASIELSLFHLVSTSPLLVGAALKEKATNGLAPIFGDAAWSAGTSVRALAGYEFGKHLLIGSRYQHDWTSTPVIDSTSVPLPTLSKPTSITWDYGGVIQYRNATLALPFAAAVSVGGRRVDNYTDLPKVTLRTDRAAVDPTTGVQTEVERSTDARAGTINPEFVHFVDSDVLLVPKQTVPVSFRIFGRGLYSRVEGSSQRNSGGFDVGVYRTGPGKDPIFDRAAALVVQVVEARPGDKKTNLGNRVSLGFVADLTTLVGSVGKLLGI